MVGVMVKSDPNQWRFRSCLRRIKLDPTIDVGRLRAAVAAEVRPLVGRDAPDAHHFFGDWESFNRVLLAPTGGGQLTGLGNARLELSFSEGPEPAIELRVACGWVVVLRTLMSICIDAGGVAVPLSSGFARVGVVAFLLVMTAAPHIHFLSLLFRTLRGIERWTARAASANCGA